MANLVVKRTDGAPIEILGIGVRTNRVQYELLPRANDPAERRIRIVIPVLQYPRSVDDLIRIDTDAPIGGRLMVPVHVRSRRPS